MSKSLEMSKACFKKIAVFVLALAAHMLKSELCREDEQGPCARVTCQFMKHSIFLFICMKTQKKSFFPFQLKWIIFRFNFLFSPPSFLCPNSFEYHTGDPIKWTWVNQNPVISESFARLTSCYIASLLNKSWKII